MNDFIALRSRLKQLAENGWQVLDDAARSLKADSVIFWANDDDSDFLESVYAQLHPKLLGFRQSLTSGLISQVYLSGMPLLEKDMKARSEHDPTMDEQANISCQSMIAAPVSPNEQIVGVLSAVRFETENRVNGFSLSDLNQLVQISSLVANDLKIGEGGHVA